MALSNWATLAFDTKGKPCDGTLTVVKASVEFYKNWLYVKDKDMWVKGRSFSNSVIAQVNSGSIQISKFDITAKRHENQNAIFACVISYYGKKKKIMVGIGCYGFINETKVYIEKLKLDPTKDWSCGSANCDANGKQLKEWVNFMEYFDEDKQDFVRVDIPKDKEIPFKDMWVGVEQSTYEAFLKFLDELVEDHELSEEYVDKIKSLKPEQFNQGDAFFAKELGQKLEKQNIGEKHTPTLTKILTEENNEPVQDKKNRMSD